MVLVGATAFALSKFAWVVVHVVYALLHTALVWVAQLTLRLLFAAWHEWCSFVLSCRLRTGRADPTQAAVDAAVRGDNDGLRLALGHPSAGPEAAVAALRQAAAAGHLACVRTALGAALIHADAAHDHAGARHFFVHVVREPLLDAIARGNADIAATLVEAAASHACATATATLTFAVACGASIAHGVLVRAGAAATRSLPVLARLAVRWGAVSQASVLRVACVRGHAHVAAAFIDARADLPSLLQLAAAHGQLDVVRALLAGVPEATPLLGAREREPARMVGPREPVVLLAPAEDA